MGAVTWNVIPLWFSRKCTFVIAEAATGKNYLPPSMYSPLFVHHTRWGRCSAHLCTTDLWRTFRQHDRTENRSLHSNILFLVRSTELGSRVLFCAAAKAARRVVNSSVTDSMMDDEWTDEASSLM